MADSIDKIVDICGRLNNYFTTLDYEDSKIKDITTDLPPPKDISTDILSSASAILKNTDEAENVTIENMNKLFSVAADYNSLYTFVKTDGPTV